MLVGGVDGSVNMAEIDSLDKITYEKLLDFCCPGGLFICAQIVYLNKYVLKNIENNNKI